MKSTSEKISRDLQISFDVGHSSIGWAVLQSRLNQHPDILGCGAVTFGADDCLASQRRGFRRQRRHIRATRCRIARMEKLLVHLGVMTPEQLAEKHTQAGGHPAPWLLAARVLSGGKLLTWPELWDVLRWYAHNRGYDGNRRWSNAEEADDDDTEKEENAKKLMEKHQVSTMAEPFCADLGLDPLGERLASTKRFKGNNAAFPRNIVEKEVRRILEAHISHLPHVDSTLERTLLDDAGAIPCPAYKLAKRFDGGLLFGQSVPRFDNRILTICPVSGEKVCTKNTPEFFLYRWLMQLANVRIVRPQPALTKDERQAIHQRMIEAGAFTPGEFKKTVADATGNLPNNLETMLMDPYAGKALILSPLTKLIQSERVQFLWPHFPEPIRERIQKRARGKWRNGDTLRLRQVLSWCDELGHPSADILAAVHSAESLKGKKPAKAKKGDPSDPLDAPLSIEKPNGRAPYARSILKQVAEEILYGFDPRKKSRSNDPLGGEDKANDGCLVRDALDTKAVTPFPSFEKWSKRWLKRLANSRNTEKEAAVAYESAEINASLDSKTNNHLVRHRLLVLQRLVADILTDSSLVNGQPERIGAIAIEVNGELRELSGKYHKSTELKKLLAQQLYDFTSVVEKLEEDLADSGIKITPGLIRKARVAKDMGMQCPYTQAKEFCSFQLARGVVDKDHIIPYSQRPSNSLDSLVITYPEVNKWKSNRTAFQFVKEEEGKQVPGRPDLTMVSLQKYRTFVDNLKISRRKNPSSGEWEDTDDGKRQRRRKKLLLLPKWEDKDAGFLPRDLTVTSQLTRLGALVLQRSLPHLQPHEITSLPGSVTGTIRTGWKLLGCLATANPGVLEPDGTLKNKTDIRSITHLHHALDALVIGLTHHYFPKNGRLWEAIVRREKQRNAEDNALLLQTGLYQRTQHGVIFAMTPPDSLVAQIRTRLAERRVTQHIPADMGGVRAEQNTWGVTGVEDGWVSLRQQMRGPDGKKQPLKTDRQKTGKVMGLLPGKLKNISGALVIGDNFGLALDPKPVVIPWQKVWHRLQEIKEKNGAKMPRLWRNGMLLQVDTGTYAGQWRILSIQTKKNGDIKLDLCKPDIVKSRYDWTDPKTGKKTKKIYAGCKLEASLGTILAGGGKSLPTGLVGVCESSQSKLNQA